MPDDKIDFTPRNEIVRRIPKPNLEIIESKLEQVLPIHISALHSFLAKQEIFFADGSFIYNEIFPFVVLKAVNTGEISIFQFASLLTLWGNLSEIALPKSDSLDNNKIPKFVPMFTDDGEINAEAKTLLMPGLYPPKGLQALVKKSPKELMNGIYEKIIRLPKSEQGFWVIFKNASSTSESVLTVTDAVKFITGIKYLAWAHDDSQEIIPSFGLRQAFLDTAFTYAVRINPVIGDSSPADIRNGSFSRHRDIALPFPGNELPRFADGFLAPLALDFIYHDFYHAVRASRVYPYETEIYVAIGDRLNIMQRRYNDAVKIITGRYEEHIGLLPKFHKAIEKLPVAIQQKTTEELLKKINQEVAIISILKKMRKSTGQLKFFLWDIEHPKSGDGIYDGPKISLFKELKRIVENIKFHMERLGILANTVRLSNYAAKRVAQVVLETIQPDPSILSTLQNEIRLNLLHLYAYGIKEKKQENILVFERTIAEAHVDTVKPRNSMTMISCGSHTNSAEGGGILVSSGLGLFGGIRPTIAPRVDISTEPTATIVDPKIETVV